MTSRWVGGEGIGRVAVYWWYAEKENANQGNTQARGLGLRECTDEWMGAFHSDFHEQTMNHNPGCEGSVRGNRWVQIMWFEQS